VREIMERVFQIETDHGDSRRTDAR
jgi:hypothetical protein